MLKNGFQIHTIIWYHNNLFYYTFTKIVLLYASYYVFYYIINIKYWNENTFQKWQRHIMYFASTNTWLVYPYCFFQVVTLLYLCFIIALGIPASLTSTCCGLLQWKLTYYVLLLSSSLLHNSVQYNYIILFVFDRESYVIL